MDVFGIYREDIELVTKTLKETLETMVPSGTKKTINESGVEVIETFSVPIYFGGDTPGEAEFTTPSLVLYNPQLSVFKELLTNLDEYIDFDYETLTAKQLDEPIPVKLKFSLFSFSQNPSNDNMLLSFLIKLRHKLTYLDLKLSDDIEDYLRVMVFITEPNDYVLDENYRMRELEIEVWTYLYSHDYSKVNLIQGQDGVVVSIGEYDESSIASKQVTSFNVFPSTTTIAVDGNLKKYPLSGSVSFMDGDIFTYTSRSLTEFYGVTGLKKFHSFGSVLMHISN